MQHKGFNFELKSIDEQGTFEGYAAVFGNKDLGGDVIEQGAFKKTLNENPKMPILWQHNPHEPIGVTTEAYEDEKGLRVKGQLNLETTKGREAYALLKQGALKGLSIGYDAIKEVWDGTIRRLKEIRLWEWSLVTFPMNPQAQVTSVKAEKDADFNALLYEIIALCSGIKAGHIQYNTNRSLIKQVIKSMQELIGPSEDVQVNDESLDESKSDDHLLDETIEEIRKFLKEVS